MENNIYIRIGKRIRKIRSENKSTLLEISEKAGVSKSLLSKIENGRTIPSLPVLLQIIKALNHDVSMFFEGITEEHSYAFIHRKAGEYEIEEREDAEGFSYFSVMSENIHDVAFQSFILKLKPGAKRGKVETDGFTFLYMIDGEIDYILDNHCLRFKTGDSLFFDGKIPHVPQNNSKNTATILVIYLITSLNK